MSQDKNFNLALHLVKSLVEVARIFVVTLMLGIYHGLLALIPTKYYPKKSVRNNVVLITGAGSGVGRLLALKMAERGARVVGLDIDGPAVNQTVRMIKHFEKGCEPKAYVCDLSSREYIYKVAQQVKDEIGDVDILINNAGVVTGKDLLDCPDDSIVKTMHVNCLAHFWTVKSFLPRMIERNSGHIVTIASGAGMIAINGLADYCASKFGVIGFHESLDLELSAKGVDNVHMTLVCPYYINTGMFDGVTTKFPLTLPIMDPEYAARKIINAILMNQKMLAIPRLLYLFFFLKNLLPVRVGHYLGHSMEVTKSMANFKGREKKKRI